MESVVFYEWSNVPDGFPIWLPGRYIHWPIMNHSFFLLGLAVCSCNQTLYINLYMPIGGGGVLIVVLDLGLSFLDGAFCHTVEGGNLHLHCKLTL